MRSRETSTAGAALAAWLGAAIAIVYGFAKLNGSQFTVLDSVLAKPMGEVSGFWLTWHYFGYSPVYGSIIALAQIVGGILLIVPATRVLGALVLLPLVVNIVLVDIFYGIYLGAMMVALAWLAALLIVIGPHVRRLLSTVLLSSASRLPAAARVLTACVFIAGAWGFTYWTANYNNRQPTPIDGVWRVSNGAAQGAAVDRVFFERNLAHMAVFRSRDGSDDRRHFEVDDDGRVQIWETWLRKGDRLWEGRILSEDNIELDAVQPSNARLILVREAKAP